MIAQYIKVGTWNLLIYYNASLENKMELADSLLSLGATKREIKKALQVLRNKNTGFTFSNSDQMMSIVCIGEAENNQQFLDTIVHELKHVQSHICSFYNVEEDSEEAAYLIGYMIQKMYKFIKLFLCKF